MHESYRFVKECYTFFLEIFHTDKMTSYFFPPSVCPHSLFCHMVFKPLRRLRVSPPLGTTWSEAGYRSGGRLWWWRRLWFHQRFAGLHTIALLCGSRCRSIAEGRLWSFHWRHGHRLVDANAGCSGALKIIHQHVKRPTVQHRPRVQRSWREFSWCSYRGCCVWKNATKILLFIM